jgi:outer membrane protein assembly factor BamB
VRAGRAFIVGAVGALAFSLASPTGPSAAAAAADASWPRFGVDPAGTSAFPGPTGIARADLPGLKAQQIAVPGIVDSSPLYLSAAEVAGETRAVFVVATQYGRALALDAASGAVLWRFAPAGIKKLDGGPSITTASPVADPEARFVYVAAPDGKLRKLAVADGTEVRTGHWPVTVTRQPHDDKISASLNLAGDYVIAMTAAFRDQPPWQGHLMTIDRRSGKTVGVFNVICTDTQRVLKPGECGHNGGGIWGRGGVAVVPGNHRLVLATGNAAWNGRTAWGDSLLLLSPDARRVLGDWTPANYRSLEKADLDLGSGSPALLRYRHRWLAIHGAKDGIVRLFDVDRLRTGDQPGHSPGLLAHKNPPGTAGFFSAPAVWQSKHMVFMANRDGTSAYAVQGDGPKLVRVWQRSTGGTSPVLAGGVLYVYEFVDGALNALDPATGTPLATLPAAHGHWQSPVVAGGRIALGVGDARGRATAGKLLLYAPPGSAAGAR